MRWMFLCIVLFGTWGCKTADVEGVYHLESSQMKQIAKEEVAALPKKKAQFAQFQRAMLGRMTVTLEMRAGGEARMVMSMPNPFMKGRIEKRIDRGTWRFSWGKLELHLTPDGKSTPNQSTCSWTKEKIICLEDPSGKKSPLVFRRKK